MSESKPKDFSEFCVSIDATIIDAITKIEKNGSRSTVVLSGSKVAGVLTEGDILRALMKGGDVYSPLQPFVQKSFKYLFEENYEEFLAFVKRFGITMVPILSEDFSLKGVMTLSALLAKMKIEG